MAKENFYEAIVLFKDGDISKRKFFANKQNFNQNFLELISEEGNKTEDNLNLEQISRIMVYENGSLIDGNLPPLSDSNKRKEYIFSQKGLLKIVKGNSPTTFDVTIPDRKDFDNEYEYEEAVKEQFGGNKYEIEIVYDNGESINGKIITGSNNVNEIVHEFIEEGNGPRNYPYKNDGNSPHYANIKNINIHKNGEKVTEWKLKPFWFIIKGGPKDKKVTAKGYIHSNEGLKVIIEKGDISDIFKKYS